MAARPLILFAGGGTGGHLYPGVAVAAAMADADPLFLCTRRAIDGVILGPTGFAFEPQPIVPPATSIAGLLRFWRSWRETKDQVRAVLRDRRPAAVVGLGGYAAGVAVKLAAEAKIPTAILNPDVIPGKANTFLMRYARAVCCGFAATADHVVAEHCGKLRVTGCPIRAEITALPDRAVAVARLGLDPDKRTLVVTGASLGAQTVNEASLRVLPNLPMPGWQVLHLAGRDHAAAVRAGYAALPTVAATIVDFTPAMADVWAVADLCVSRSGASSCAELTAVGVPSILMPYPFHKDMHQRANANVLADAGGAVLVDDARDVAANEASLRPVLKSLINDAGRRRAMAQAARAIGRPDAAAAVAAVVRELAE